jgi:hypothetical protein
MLKKQEIWAFPPDLRVLAAPILLQLRLKVNYFFSLKRHDQSCMSSNHCYMFVSQNFASPRVICTL